MAQDFTVQLAAGRTSSVIFLDGIKALSHRLSSYGSRAVWVFDENSARLFTSLPEHTVVLPSGEEYKTWASVEKILTAALDAHLSRDSWFIGFGGGVVCDLTALASSLYMRGSRLILVPTTLLCMVDATLGGKSAIDFKGGKNLVGTFWPARDVLITPACLRTLPDVEYMSGMGEVLKHAFLSADHRLYDLLMERKDAILARDKDVLLELLDLSLHVKASYLERDPEETKGIRQALNLGHTFAHALESIENFTVKHGMAVAWGLSRAMECGVAAGVTPSWIQEKADGLLRFYGYDIDRRIERGRWLDWQAATAKDKKNFSGTINFVLLEDWGRPVLRPLDSALVRSAVIRKA